MFIKIDIWDTGGPTHGSVSDTFNIHAEVTCSTEGQVKTVPAKTVDQCTELVKNIGRLTLSTHREGREINRQVTKD